MLEIENLSRRFNGRSVLRDISLQVEPGEYVAIIGESGVGKSTLLNLIAGLDRPDAGRLTLDRTDYSNLDEDALTRLRRQKLELRLPGLPHPAPPHPAPERGPAPVAQGPQRCGGRRARATTPRRRGPGGRAGSWPRELSGGELQRVAIARALVDRPRLVLADEPTGNLDPANGAKVLALLAERIRGAGAIGILVTHSAEGAKIADRVLRLTAEGLHG